MQYGSYAKKYRVKPRFYLFLVVLLGLTIWGIAALLSLLKPASIEWGRLSSSQPISAIVLRDETVVLAEEYAKIACIATEGGSVKAGDPLVMQYLTGFSENDIIKLANKRNDIKDYQENNILKDVNDQDLKVLNDKIDAKLKEISDKSINSQTQDLAITEQELRSLMDERKAYMLTKVNPDDALNLLYQQEASLEEKINRTRKVLPSPAEGLVSFYLDGYEGKLTVASIEKMTPGTMKALMNDLINEGQSYASEETVLKDQAICRIVNPAKWYAVIVMNARENPMIEGTEREVTFDGLQGAVMAKVVKVITEGRNSVSVLEVPEGVPEMLSLRLVNGHLGQDIEGFRVPISMVLEDNGHAYIAIKGANGGAQRVEVTLLGRDEKYAIISETSGQGVLAMGLVLVKP